MRISRWMLVALAACGGGAHPEYAAQDPCAALAITAVAPTTVEQDGISDALALWGSRGVAAFDAAPADAGSASASPAAVPTIEIRFDTAAATFHGVYDPVAGRILVNRDLTDGTDRAQLAIVIAHELGHVFGLAHIPPATRLSLMNPGNLVTPPTDADQRALEALWGTCR